MYKENLHTKEEKFGNVKIAHLGLFFGTQKNCNAGD